ncbi:helix-turn-helix domain-containing protein [Pseudarthrobacter sulfonivorans]|jgi:DNA-binding HxlR family transcriptional regulator|uniref:winged helix-turn-helix transcriptional regulator n=1 Tax=Pseudarthrobacter sulfonivorans TaxID=121292 RepID=UPI0028609335|nr:helix-turn-helix domain-containing protein [Pseudarthrobacter sulfonivorans]MDR6414385.1 DNA-binding HxlR family transcriptional regulator [Pseudarthrobacter sulfonivorans]
MEAQTSPARLPADFADGVFPAGCPSRTVLDHITSKWGVLILLALSEGEQRWSELRRRAEGISEKMLAQTLKTLERDGLVLRKSQPVIPPRVDYSLTERGYELSGLLVPLVSWAYNNADEILNGQR